MTEYENCTLCPRNCSVDRRKRAGYCGAGDVMRIARIAPHFWEEPCLSGKYGSGAVFFSHCSLRCVYCQNANIANGLGREVSVAELSEKMLLLQEHGCHNINLVTADHYAPSVVEAVKISRKAGLSIPIVYNCSGYESKETVKLLSDTVDIFLPDFKYSCSDIAKKYSNAENYPEIATEVINEMVNTARPLSFDENGLLKSGVIIRVLALPGEEKNTKGVLKTIKKLWNTKVIVSLMSQYTPMPDIESKCPSLARRLTDEEYEELTGYVKGLRLDNVYFQEGQSASESFIPDFTEDF